MGEKSMKVLVTGAKGFIGKNLIAELNQREGIEVLPFDMDTPMELLEEYCQECNFVYNLAGVNRPERTEEFWEGNFNFVSTLLDNLKKHGNTCPVMHSSSIQAVLENPYGQSKKAAEDKMYAYGKETGAPVYVYRFTNIFGKWCRPNYNSVVATFCHNIAHGLPIWVNGRDTVIHLIYIDDAVEELIRALDGRPNIKEDGYGSALKEYEVTLGEIADLLYSFKESQENLMIPNMADDSFSKKLYSTYLSYLPEDGFSYPVAMHKDERGSFTELLKSPERGQVSVNIAKPGIVKGNHWHHSKNEKFMVISGRGRICFRKYGEREIIEYPVSGEELKVVDIPTGYTHSIVNDGNVDLVTLIWTNECFDPERPDTIYEAVELEHETVRN